MKHFWNTWDAWTDEAEKEFVNKTGAATDSFWVQDDGSVVLKTFKVIQIVFPPKTVITWKRFTERKILREEMIYDFL